MEERKREEAPPSTTLTTTTMAFSDEIPFPSMSTSTNSSFSYQPTMSTIFDMMPPSSCDQKASPFGFMDLLSIPDFNPSMFDCLPTTTASVTAAADDAATPVNQSLPSPPSSSVPGSSEVLKTPTSPNSSSISSSSNEATAANNGGARRSSNARNEHEAGDEGGDGDGARGDDQDLDKTKKQLKPKKKNQKKERAQRFAFMTKSDVDHLDDGYRWRKYGQKAVKNSPYPRSYYRCTTPGCGVKKRVERSTDDPSIVVNTYEGQHTHICPATSRASSLGYMHPNAGGALASTNLVLPQHHYHQFQQQQNVMQAAPLVYNSTPPLSIVSPASNYMNSSSSFSGYVQDREVHGGFGSSRLVHEAFLRDNGLLQDIVVPTQMKREDRD